MKSVWIVWCVLFAVTAQSAEIASLTFEKLEPLLKELVLANPQYAELKGKLEAAGEFDPTAFMKTDDNGNIVLGKEHLQQASKMTSRFAVEKSLREAMRRELVLLIDGMGLSYAVVLNGNVEDAILHSRAEIEDITQKVYQELVKRLSQKTPDRESGVPADRP